MFGIDGNAIDMATIGAGLLAVLVRPLRCVIGKRAAWNRQKAVTDFLNGSSIVPFAVMGASTFWTWMLEEVLKSKISLGLAGVVGFLFILGEVMSAGKDESKQP